MQTISATYQNNISRFYRKQKALNAENTVSNAQTNYVYGFQNQEKDDEIKGSGNSVNYEYRMHDTRLGRFFAVDPIAKDFPWNSPYAFSENQVIHAVELEGLETSNDLNYRDPSVQKMTPEQKQSFNSGQRQAGAAALAVAVDIFITKGWLSRTFFLHELGSEMNATDRYNEAKANGNSQEAAKQQERMKAHGLTTTLGAVGEIGGYFIAKGMGAIQKAGIRKQLASDFYKQSGYSTEKAASHMEGINFDKAVQTTTLKKGTIVQQWVGENGVGNYFTTAENSAKNLGISYEGRILKQFKLTEDVKVLQSTASDFKGNAGGGKQYFSTELKNNITPITE